MGQNRRAAFRYRVIDALLKNGHTRTLTEIKERVSEAIRTEFGDEKGISERTLFYDFETMRQAPPSGFSAPIECHQGYYQYAETGFSIFKAPIDKADKKLVAKAIELLEQLKYIPLVRELIAFLKDMAGADQNKDTKHLLFEQQRLSTGLEKMDIVQKAVVQQKPLDIIYLPFHEDLPLDMQVHPYLIKEYRNRWYLIGWEKMAGKIFNLALDRMVTVQITNSHFLNPPPNFNPSTWFSDVVGVTIPDGLECQKIKFQVNLPSAPYVRTKPIHPSQILEDKLTDGSMVFSIDVIPNFELEMIFLGFGDNLEVLSPAWFRNKIAERVKKAGALYYNN